VPIDVIWTLVAVAFAVIAVAALVLAVSIARLAGRLAALSESARRIAAVVERELPPTITEIRALTARAERLSAEVQPRLARLDALMDEATVTLRDVQESAAALRGPLSAVAGVRRRLGLGGGE
jgi:uncharacterized protein YoxC